MLNDVLREFGLPVRWRRDGRRRREPKRTDAVRSSSRRCRRRGARASASAPCWSGVGRGMAEEDLDELAALADSAGADPVARIVQSRAEPDPGTYVGKGKLGELHDVIHANRAERGDPGPRADARAAALARGAAGGEGDRSDRADPGHLRVARAFPRGQGAGGARAAQLPVATAARLGRGDVAPRRRHRHPRSRRDEDGGRPPAHPPTDLEAASRHPGHGTHARREARSAARTTR